MANWSSSNFPERGAPILNTSPPELDVVIPVYNEGASIAHALDALSGSVRTSFRVLICYDFDEDDTLSALANNGPWPFEILFVKSRAHGALSATLTGFEAATADAVLVLPADDDYNAPRIDAMVEQFRTGCDVVCANRFANVSRRVGYPLLKTVLARAASLALHHAARLPTHDASNGLRLFSKRVIKGIPIETKEGFGYSIELLVKSHRLGWRIGEVPADWIERKNGQSRFQLVRWLPSYWRWFRYAFATTHCKSGVGA